MQLIPQQLLVSGGRRGLHTLKSQLQESLLGGGTAPERLCGWRLTGLALRGHRTHPR